MPPLSPRSRRIAAALAVIVLLLIMMPRNSSAQTPGTIALGTVSHEADGTTVVPLTASSADIAALSVTIDGESVPFEVSDSSTDAASRIVFVIENSVSMTAFQLADVQARMLELTASLGAADEVGIVTYGGAASTALPLTTNRATFETAVNGITVDGSSALYSGVATAGEMLAPAGGPSLIVLVTYGWDWGAVSTHSRDASITAVAESGASVYVQSMIYDAGIDSAYLAPLASEGFVHDVAQLATLPGSALAITDDGAPQSTVTISAPPLAQGAHELGIAGADGIPQTAKFEVTNDGLFTLSVDSSEDATAPITVQIESVAGLSGIEFVASVGGTTLEVGSDGSMTIDPWTFADGAQPLAVAAFVNGELAANLAQSINIPTLEPTITVDQSDGQILVATLQAQPGTANEFVAVVDDTVVAGSVDGRIEVERPANGTLTFEARTADGAVVASQVVAATAAVGAPSPGSVDEGESSGSSPWTSPLLLVVPLALIALVLLIKRRRTRSNSNRAAFLVAEEPAAAIDEVNDFNQLDEVIEFDEFAATGTAATAEVDNFAEVEASQPLDEPIPLAPKQKARSPRLRLGRFDRSKTRKPTPLSAADWAVVVRARDGQTQRIDIGYEPVSIGASKLCTVTLDGETVRFVHLVLARDGHEVKAHQFGPVSVDGKDRSVEDSETLTETVMEIGDVSVWLEPAVHIAELDAAASDAA